MTNERQLTPTQIARKFLEDKLHQNVAGGNRVRTDPFQYGQLGVQGGESTYEDAMNSEKIKEAKDQIYNAAREEGKSLGVFGEPNYPTNYDISLKISKLIEESKATLSLGELKQVVGGVADGFEFSVPKELREYVPHELYVKDAKARAAKQSKKKAEDLTEQETDALLVYQEILSPAYDRGIALRASQSGYFADLNQLGKQVSEKYKPEEE